MLLVLMYMSALDRFYDGRLADMRFTGEGEKLNTVCIGSGISSCTGRLLVVLPLSAGPVHQKRQRAELWPQMLLGAEGELEPRNKEVLLSSFGYLAV